MTEEPSKRPTQAPLPRPITVLFAAVFVLGCMFSLVTEGDPKVTIFLGAAALLALGVDIGSLWGRK